MPLSATLGNVFAFLLACLQSFFGNVPNLSCNFVDCRQRTFLPKALPKLIEGSVWIVFNISGQLFQFFGAEYGDPVASRSRSVWILLAFTNSSANGFGVVAKNIGALLPTGSSGPISGYDNRANFRSCYTHRGTLTNVYNFSKLKCLTSRPRNKIDNNVSIIHGNHTMYSRKNYCVYSRT